MKNLLYIVIILFSTIPSYSQNLSSRNISVKDIVGWDDSKSSLISESPVKESIGSKKVEKWKKYSSFVDAAEKEFPFGFESKANYWKMKPTYIQWIDSKGNPIATIEKDEAAALCAESDGKYDGWFGVDTSISVESGAEKWKENVTISKGMEPPKGAEYLEISFSVDTSYSIPDGEIKDRLELAEA